MNTNPRNPITQALDAQFRADLLQAIAQLEIFLNNSVGISDHADIVGECAKLVEKIVSKQDCIKYVQQLYMKSHEEEDVLDSSDLEATVHGLVEKMDKFLTALGQGEE